MVFQELVNYVRADNGAWRAEFHGIIDVVVAGNTLERCRRLALEAFDQGLSAYLEAHATSLSTKHAETGNKQIATGDEPAALQRSIRLA
jgi:hypothetical protein